MSMRVDCKVYKTAIGTLTNDPGKAATVFLPNGAHVSPAMLKAEPGLGKFIPIIREQLEAEAKRKKAEEAENKKQTTPPNKGGSKPPNKGGSK